METSKYHSSKMTYLITRIQISPKGGNPYDDFPIPIKNTIGRIKDEFNPDAVIHHLHQNQAYIDYKTVNNMYIPISNYDEEIAKYFDIYGGDYDITVQDIVYGVSVCMYKIRCIELLTPSIINNPAFYTIFQYDFLNRNNILNMTWHNYRMNVHFIGNLNKPDLTGLKHVDFSYIHSICKTRLFSHQMTNLQRMFHIHHNPKSIQISDNLPIRFENDLIYDMTARLFISATDYQFPIHGGMILDEPGTGKTLQFILYLMQMYHDHGLKGLVLVPNHNIKQVWMLEYCKHIDAQVEPVFDIFTFDELDSTALANYAIIGIDEIHNLYKQHNLQTARFFRAIVESPIKYRWGLTGTPFVNDVSLFSLIKFLAGHNFGNERLSNSPYIQDQFREFFLKNCKTDMVTDYVWPAIHIHNVSVELDIVQQKLYDAERMINRDKGMLRRLVCDINLLFDQGEIKTPDELKTYGIQHYKQLYLAEQAKLDKLQQQLDAIIANPQAFQTQEEFIQRKSHFAFLVERQRTDTERHAKAYAYFMNSIEAINKLVLAKPADMETSNDCDENCCKICWAEYTLPIAYLKQCGHYFCRSCIDGMKTAQLSMRCPMCRHPIQMEDTINVNTISDINNSSKIHELLKLIHPDERYIIFTQFPSVINRIQSYLTSNGITSASLASYTEEQVLILSSEQNAEGINLSHFDKMIIFEPFEDTIYTNEVERQLIARIHRVGRTAPVSVYRFITKGTIEEDIYQNYSNL